MTSFRRSPATKYAPVSALRSVSFNDRRRRCQVQAALLKTRTYVKCFLAPELCSMLTLQPSKGRASESQGADDAKSSMAGALPNLPKPSNHVKASRECDTEAPNTCFCVSQATQEVSKSFSMPGGAYHQRHHHRSSHRSDTPPPPPPPRKSATAGGNASWAGSTRRHFYAHA